MNKLLTIAIPTFNRALILERQLAWLAQAIQGFENECEIIISDNCSTDNTSDAIAKWQPILSNAQLKLNRHSKNIGAVRNIAYCINSATSKYVWTIGDDDPIKDVTIAYILRTLSAEPDLALLILNFSKRHARTGEIVFERCFAIEDEVTSDGKAVIERCLEERSGGGVALTTALVYRTELAQNALQNWSNGLNNLLVQIYWTGFCALGGSVKVTKDNYLECTAGTHHFGQDKNLSLSRHGDAAAVFVKLMELGYSPKLCQQLVLKRFTAFRGKVILSRLQRSPMATLAVLSRYFEAVWRVSWENMNLTSISYNRANLAANRIR